MRCRAVNILFGLQRFVLPRVVLTRSRLASAAFAPGIQKGNN
jgi:hypothetical protein